MSVLRRLDLRCGSARGTQGDHYYHLGVQSVTVASLTVRWEGTGVAKVDVT